MSKSTKIIAGLGVAAALGVAALPMATFADTSGTHTVTVTASVEGSIIVKANTGDITEASTDITGGSNTGNIAFGDLGIGDQAVHDEVTVIDITTNYPNGYELNANAGQLSHQTEGSTAFIDRASAQAFTTGEGTFTGSTSVWGIKVTKANWDYTAQTPGWSGTAGTLSAGADYTTTDYNAVANGVIDDTGVLSTQTRSKYTMNYGIGIATGQASGNYSGQVVYTVTATDYSAS